MTVYIIKSLDNCNFVYVNTREEALRICTGMPGVFTWEPLNLYRAEDDM